MHANSRNGITEFLHHVLRCIRTLVVRNRKMIESPGEVMRQVESEHLGFVSRQNKQDNHEV
jgi:hypothetical protein